jgi:hypothetical protein
MANDYLGSGVLRFIEFLAREKNPQLVPTALEAVRNLLVINDGPTILRS